MVRLPGICNHNPETTVLAHLPGAGVGIKHPDLWGAFCCSACHDAIDGRVKTDAFTPSTLRLLHLEAVIRTQEWWIEHGYITVR